MAKTSKMEADPGNIWEKIKSLKEAITAEGLDAQAVVEVVTYHATKAEIEDCFKNGEGRQARLLNELFSLLSEDIRNKLERLP